MKEQQSWDDKLRFVLRRYKENSLDPEGAWSDFAGRHGIPKRTALRRYMGAVAAVLLLLIGLSGKYYLDRIASEWVTVTAMAGEYKEVLLPDSTSVSLAENSVIRYDKKKYGKGRRAVEMKGKAFFEVTSDEALPFSVQTEQTLTMVMGTSFQLEEKERATFLHVKTGKVRFTGGEDKQTTLLTAGMSARYSKEDGLQVEEQEIDINYLAWKYRQLRFRNTPLEQVIRQVSEAYQVKIINNTPVSDDLRLTSYFDNQTLDELLSVINETLDIQLEVYPVD